MRTVKVFVGSGIEMGGRICDISCWAGLSCLGWSWDAFGRRGRGRPSHIQFERGLEVGGYATGFFGGGEHPLIQRGADAAALGLVFDDYEAQEAESRGEAGSHGIDARKHAVEGEGHVIVFGELEDGEHAALGYLSG